MKIKGVKGRIEWQFCEELLSSFRVAFEFRWHILPTLHINVSLSPIVIFFQLALKQKRDHTSQYSMGLFHDQCIIKIKWTLGSLIVNVEQTIHWQTDHVNLLPEFWVRVLVAVTIISGHHRHQLASWVLRAVKCMLSPEYTISDRLALISLLSPNHLMCPGVILTPAWSLPVQYKLLPHPHPYNSYIFILEWMYSATDNAMLGSMSRVLLEKRSQTILYDFR